MKRYFVILALMLASTLHGQIVFDTSFVSPRMRVIVDNDFSGDPDGLFQLAHIMLSPSVEVRGIIGSHLKKGDGFDPSVKQADNAAAKARELLQIMNIGIQPSLIAGSNTAMPDDSTAVQSSAVDFIITEAMRTDTKLPLYILCRAGLQRLHQHF